MSAEKKPLRAWQRMLSGRRLDLLAPKPEDIEIEDIAHGLARVARWNGQTVGDHAFSVAQHSVLVSDIVAAIEPDFSARELRSGSTTNLLSKSSSQPFISGSASAK
jgi:hypothetical protein